MTYLCPDFDTGPCFGQYMVLDGQCAAMGGFQRGACFATPFTVEAGRQYELYACTSCSGGCGTPLVFTTPPSFAGPTYDPGNIFFCQYSCARPGACF